MSALKCDHCLLTFPQRDAIYDNINEQERVFCCSGCRGVYKLIHEEGLYDFYDKRKWDEVGISSSLFKKEIDIKPFTEYVKDAKDSWQSEENRGHKEIDIFIDGVRCASCVWLNEKILNRTEGIEYARVNYATHKAKIRWDPEVIGLDRIIKRIISIGYEPKPYSESEQFKRQKAETKDLLVRFGTAGFLSSQLMIYSVALYAGYFEGIDEDIELIFKIIAMILTTPIVLYAGLPIFKNAAKGLRHLHFSVDSLISLGSGSAFVYSVYRIFVGGSVYFDTSAMLITLLLLGKYIEAGAKSMASEATRRLSELIPKHARLVMGSRKLSGGSQERQMTPVSSIKVGDFIEVIPGERISLDGVVVNGESEIDESIITGESMPALKSIGSNVIGGSMNLYGTIMFQVTKTVKETVLSNIIRSVQDAQIKKPKIQILADKIVGVFVPAIIVIALLTIAAHMLNSAPLHVALMVGISVLVIACPCSLGLATPLAVLIFSTKASEKGILVRSGEVVENVSKLTHVIFDKTGTITEGKPILKEMVVVDKALSKDDLLVISASIERLSEHSISLAIVAAAHEFKLLDVTEFKAVPGRGVMGTINNRKIFIGNRNFVQENGVRNFSDDFTDKISNEFENSGDTLVYMAWDGEIRAIFAISDIVRGEMPNVVSKLRDMNIDISIVSGDNKVTTNSIASMINIDNVVAEASPIKKKEIIRGIQQGDGGNKNVMMVGDGINDAPALTEALVGVAMGRGTDIAIESADAVLIRRDLGLIPDFMNISKRTYRIIRQNIFWAFFYNTIAIPLAIAGMLHPIVAAGAMVTSSLCVVGNSLRIKGKWHKIRKTENLSRTGGDNTEASDFVKRR